MKLKLVLLAISLGIGTQAYAVITDTFDCKLTITNGDGSELLSQSDRLAVIRKPEGKKDGYIFTRGYAKMVLQTKENGVLKKVGVHLVIRHAVQELQSPEGVAFQSTCFSPETFACNQASCLDKPMDIGSCTPGSPEKYGKRVPVVQGLPTVDTSQIRESELDFGPENGKAKLDCKYTGTYQ